MRVALGLLLAVPVAAAGAFAALSTDSPASDLLDLGWTKSETAGAARATAMSQAPIIIAQAMTTQAPQAGKSATSTGSAAVVVDTVGRPEQIAQAAAGGDTSSRQTSRTELAKSLQKELKRVGCFTGDVNGEWTATSQQAMTAFLQKLNAKLPTAEPDFILLTLVQGQTAQACATATPAATVAQRSPVTKSAPTVLEAAAVGAVAIGAVAATKAPEVGAAWRTTVVQPTQPVQMAKQPDSSPVATASVTPAQTSATAAAIPGRMAVGGPVNGAEAATAPQPQANPRLPEPRESRSSGGNSNGNNSNNGASRSKSAAAQAPTPSGGTSAPLRRVDPPRERTAHVERPRRDTSWTKSFFDR